MLFRYIYVPFRLAYRADSDEVFIEANKLSATKHSKNLHIKDYRYHWWLLAPQYGYERTLAMFGTSINLWCLVWVRALRRQSLSSDRWTLRADSVVSRNAKMQVGCVPYYFGNDKLKKESSNGHFDKESKSTEKNSLYKKTSPQRTKPPLKVGKLHMYICCYQQLHRAASFS